MMWCSKESHCLWHQHPIWVVVCVLPASLLLQLPDKAPWKREDDPTPRAPTPTSDTQKMLQALVWLSSGH